MISNLLKMASITLILVANLTGVTAVADTQKDLPEVQYIGYKVVHHMGAVVEHLENFGINTFDHPRIGDYRSFVITPALDHFYSKAVADVRFGPVVIETGAKDDRYSSIQIFDMEHYTIFDQITSKDGERFVIVRDDYKGKLPQGTVIKTKSNFPFVFLRTQSFAFNDDKLSDAIRHQARITGISEPIDLPNSADTQALIQWTIDNKIAYSQTKKLMAEAARTYTPEIHKQTYDHLAAFVASGAVVGNPGMFEDIDDPAGGDNKIRAAGTLLGHLGFPVHHAYYQNVAVDKTGKKLAGANGSFVMTVPYKPGVGQFWSVTRYGAATFLPLNPAEIGGQDIQSYNTFNMKPDDKGNVTITFSTKDPKDGTYWMPVKDDGYYYVVRYYGPTKDLNGNTAFDIIYKGTKLEANFKPVQF
jgi:hypothetical protein